METVLITGANRGIGLALARRLLTDGYRVLATCRTPSAAAELAGLAGTGDLELLPLDVADAAAVDGFAGVLAGRPLDVLVNNAGVMGGPRQSADDMDYAAWAEAFAVNTMAPLRLAQALKRNLLQAARPRVVTLSSQMGALSRHSPGAIAYRSTKAAVNKAMQTLALDWRADGIVVCPVHPGWVRTDMGGPNADLDVTDCARGLAALIAGLDLSRSGHFLTWKGEEHPW